MQFTIVALLSLVAVAFASPIVAPVEVRQIQAEAAAMSNKAGEIIAFDSAAVYKAATDAGL